MSEQPVAHTALHLAQRGTLELLTHDLESRKQRGIVEKAGPQNLKAHSSDTFIPTRTHLLKVPLPPSSSTSWTPSVQTMSLWRHISHSNYEG